MFGGGMDGAYFTLFAPGEVLWRDSAGDTATRARQTSLLSLLSGACEADMAQTIIRSRRCGTVVSARSCAAYENVILYR
jgi:hypothetical protein